MPSWCRQGWCVMTGLVGVCLGARGWGEERGLVVQPHPYSHHE